VVPHEDEHATPEHDDDHEHEHEHDEKKDEDHHDEEEETWDEDKHSEDENRDHEEVKGDHGQKLKGKLEGLATKAKMFFEADKNKDAFLAGADIPKATLKLLDTDHDNAVSFREWTHGFHDLPDSAHDEAFHKYYGEVYGTTIPSHWDSGRKEDIHDDRNEIHAMDKKGDSPSPTPPPVSPTAAPSSDSDQKSPSQEAADPGEMSETELNAALDKDFTKMDQDKNGHVTIEEYKKWDDGNEDAEHDFAVLDRNHDGKLTRVEISGNDSHDNYISHEEHEKQKEQRHTNHVKKRQEAMEKAQAQGENPAAAAKKVDDEDDEDDDAEEELEESQLRTEFDRMDENKDGKVSEDEYVKGNPGDSSARHNFKLLDRNKSKQLAFKELFPESVKKKDLHYINGKHNKHYVGEKNHEEKDHEETHDKDEHSEEHHDDEHKEDEHKEDEHKDEHKEEEHKDEEHHEEEEHKEEEVSPAVKSKFDAADSDKDGKLSAAEADSAGLRDDEGHVPADTNKDGFVDVHEFAAHDAKK